MKKTIIAIVALLASFSAPVLAQTTPPVKIGYTDVQVILERLPESKSIQNEMNVLQLQYKKTIEDKAKDYEAKVDDYQKTAPNLTEVIRADKEKVIRDLGQQIQELQTNSQNALQKKSMDLLSPVLDKIDKAIKEVGKDNGYLYILSSDAGQAGNPVILYVGDESMNVTNLVLKKLGVDPNAPVQTAAPAATAPAKTSTAPAAKPATKKP